MDDKKNEALKAKFGIRGFPTLKIFKGSLDTPAEYQGPREAAGIVKYLQKQVQPAYVQLGSKEAVQAAVKEAGEARRGEGQGAAGGAASEGQLWLLLALAGWGLAVCTSGISGGASAFLLPQLLPLPLPQMFSCLPTWPAPTAPSSRPLLRWRMRCAQVRGVQRVLLLQLGGA
jgi:hypothetical protein